MTATLRSPCRLLAAAIVALPPFAASAGTIAGRIEDDGGRRALPGAEVTLVELSRTTVSGPDGRYRFTDVAPGRYTLAVRYVGAEPASRDVQVGAQDTVRVDLQLRSGAGDTLLVIGQRANLASALSRQRASETIESVLTRDGVGQFPDQNVAEALRRAPGVNVLNDQGEGRFVSVRGLDPNLNAASINGARVPAPEADVRAVALDVLPVELIESIEVKKSLTPDMDGDAIGASIEINTTTSLDRTEPFFAMSLERSYNDLAGETSPKGSFDFSTPLGERVGLAGGVSYYDRSFSTDNVEADGWSETDGGIVFADTVEYRDYDVERRRLGASFSVDLRASERTALFARLLQSEFEDQEYRARLMLEMEGEPVAGGSGFARFASEQGEIAVTRDLKDRFEEQTIGSFVVGGETIAGPWTLDYRTSRSRAEEKENGSLDPVAFARAFAEPGELGVLFDYRELELPRFSVGSAAQAAFLDAAGYEFEQIDRTALSLSRDDESTVQFDATRVLGIARGGLEIQFGAKARRREKSYDLELEVLDGFEGDWTLADVLGRASYGLAALDPLPSGPAVRAFFANNFGAFEADAAETAFESSAADYLVEEDVQAAYALARYDAGRLLLVGGARYEGTDNRIVGNRVELVEEGAVHDGVVLDEDTVFVTPVTFERDYDHWLPSVNLRYEAAEDLLLRAGLYRSAVRPGIGNLAPRFVVEESSDGEREGEFGNPALEPYEADNLDVSAEWYFADNAAFHAGLFYKKIDNFIVVSEFEDMTFNGVFADEALIPINGEAATVRGLELAYQQALTSLRVPFDGFLVGLNYTYTDTDAELGDRRITLPAAAESTFNALLGYEKGRVSLRLAVTYRDEYLDVIGGRAEEDRWVEDHTQYDLTAKVQVADRWQLFVELVNLGDEPYVAFQRGPGQNRLLQYEEYSWTGKIGFRASF